MPKSKLEYVPVDRDGNEITWSNLTGAPPVALKIAYVAGDDDAVHPLPAGDPPIEAEGDE